MGFSASAIPDTIQVKTYGDIYENQGENLMLTTDSHYVLVGSTYASDERKSDIYVIKLDYQFNKVWSMAFGSEQLEGARSVVETSEGNYLIVGHTNINPSRGYDVLVLCVSPNGEYLWEESYGGGDWDFGYDIIKRYDGNYLLCGETYSMGEGASDVYLIKIDEDGGLIWERTYGGTGEDAAYEIMEAMDSSCYIVGKILTELDTTNMEMIKLDKNDGLVWEKNYGGPGFDVAYGVYEAENGDVLIAGSANGYHDSINDLDIQMYRFTPDLDLVWHFEAGHRSHNSVDTLRMINHDDEAFDIIERENGDIMSVGYTVTFGLGAKNAVITNIDQNGYFKPGPSPYQYFPDEVLNRCTFEGRRFVLVGTTMGEGAGNADVLLMYADTILHAYNPQIPEEGGMLYSSENITDSVELAIGMEDVVLAIDDLHIFPNPISSGVVNIRGKLLNRTDRLTIFTIDGKKIYETQQIQVFSMKLDLGAVVNIHSSSAAIVFDFLLSNGDRVIRKVLINPY